MAIRKGYCKHELIITIPSKRVCNFCHKEFNNEPYLDKQRGGECSMNNCKNEQFRGDICKKHWKEVDNFMDKQRGSKECNCKFYKGVKTCSHGTMQPEKPKISWIECYWCGRRLKEMELYNKHIKKCKLNPMLSQEEE